MRMTILFQIQINIVLSILLIILIGHAFFNMNRKATINKICIWIMELILFALILEILSVLLNNSNLMQFMVLHKLVNIARFMADPCIIFLAYIFVKEWIERYQEEKIKVNKILLLPLFINGIAALISYNGNGAFSINGQNIYERGPLFFVLPCVSYMYFGYTLYFIYKQRKKINYTESVMFYCFFIVPAIFTGIELKYYGLLITWNSAAIVIVITYIFILNDQSYRDSLTGLENRLSYEHYVQSLDCKKYNKLFMIYIDIDGFKLINDQYGHCEGDEALKTFTSFLIASFSLRKKKLIRLGGDEFLILLEEEQKEKVNSYIQNLEGHIEAYNSTGEKPYKSKFSYGMLCYTKDYENVDQLLKHTDQLMYEQKQSRIHI